MIAALLMPLVPGTRLGPYEIQAPIGAGGMGEVYRARDIRLGRTVAIKVLPSQLAATPEFRERFEREARTLSHLSHGHVCALYDVGHDAGTAFLVMEYLEGETLAARLLREPRGLPWSEAVRIAIEIAAALDAAHRLGITHRDLKPGNVMLTRSGAKLLDFGLARGEEGPILQAVDPSQPTRTVPLPNAAPLTAEGTILGTLQYMAPEQVEGLRSDARSDLFAFGAILYEMVTGRRAFQGRTQASLMGSILRDDAPPMSSPDIVLPPALEFVVRKCLAKDPDDRWQSARDLKSQLEWIAQGSSSIAPASTSSVRSSPRGLSWLLAMLLAAALVAIGVLVAQRWRTVVPASSDRDVRFLVDSPTTSHPHLVSISPDGGTLAFVARQPAGSEYLLWLRPLNSTTAEPIAKTEGAFAPFWSPDSLSVSFGADKQLMRLDVRDRRLKAICDVPAPFDFSGGTWNHEGVIVFSSGLQLFRVAAAGGTPVAVTELDASRAESHHYFPSFLPDGRHFLSVIDSSQVANAGVFVGSIDAPDRPDAHPRTRVINVVSMAMYASPGYLLYQSSGELMAQPFDASRLTVTGEPIRLAESVGRMFAGRAAFDVSASGVLAYRAGISEQGQLTWFDRSGKPVGVVGQPLTARQLVLSPDGKRLALDRLDPATNTYDLWTQEISSGVLTRLTFDPANDGDPTWSPDGQALAFSSNRTGKMGIYTRRIGASDDQRLVEASTAFLMDWTSDGRLLFHNRETIFAVPATGSQPAATVFASPFAKDEAHVSPDGHWVAYNSNESSRFEVHVASFPAFDQRRQVSSAGGGSPRWRKDGRELFYMSLDGKLMSIAVTPGPTPEFGAPTVLFQSPLASPAIDMDEYAVSGDGQRFLLLKRTDVAKNSITVMLDWTKLLKK